jgi:hypothetical protein
LRRRTTNVLKHHGIVVGPNRQGRALFVGNGAYPILSGFDLIVEFDQMFNDTDARIESDDGEWVLIVSGKREPICTAFKAPPGKRNAAFRIAAASRGLCNAPARSKAAAGKAFRVHLPTGHAVIQRIIAFWQQASGRIAHDSHDLLHDVPAIAAGRTVEEITYSGAYPRLGIVFAAELKRL